MADNKPSGLRMGGESSERSFNLETLWSSSKYLDLLLVRKPNAYKGVYSRISNTMMPRDPWAQIDLDYPHQDSDAQNKTKIRALNTDQQIIKMVLSKGGIFQNA